MKKYLPLVLGVILIVFGAVYMFSQSNSNQKMENETPKQEKPNYIQLKQDQDELIYQLDDKDKYIILIEYQKENQESINRKYFYEVPDKLHIERHKQGNQMVVEIDELKMTFRNDPALLEEKIEKGINKHTTIYECDDGFNYLKIAAIRRDLKLENIKELVYEQSMKQSYPIEIEMCSWGGSVDGAMVLYPGEAFGLPTKNQYESIVIYDLVKKQYETISFEKPLVRIEGVRRNPGQYIVLGREEVEMSQITFGNQQQDVLTFKDAVYYVNGKRYVIKDAPQAVLCEDGSVVTVDQATKTFYRYQVVNDELAMIASAILPESVQFYDQESIITPIASPIVMGTYDKYNDFYYYQDGGWNGGEKVGKPVGNYIFYQDKIVNVIDGSKYSLELFKGKDIQYVTANEVESDIFYIEALLYEEDGEFMYIHGIFALENKQFVMKYFDTSGKQFVYKDGIIYEYSYDESKKTVEIVEKRI